MKILRILLPGILLYLLANSSCFAQAVNLYCFTGTPGAALWAPCDTTNPLAITGTITASLGGFTPASSGARGTPLAVTTADSSGALAGSPGSVVVVTNVGANPMYCNVNGIAATASDQFISAGGGWFSFTIPPAQTTLHCIASGGSTTANMLAGAGLATGTGGGSGGGGGGGNVNVTQWDTTAVGVPTAYGTAPTTGNYIGVNAFVTNFPATQPISAASLPLPSGAATAALQTTGNTSLAAIAAAATTPLNNSSVPINISTATTTQLVALSGSTAIYVTSYDVIAGGTGNITFEYGTGTACATGTTVLTGAYPLTAQAGIAKGDGIGTVLKVPAGNALCALTSAGVQMSGSVSFNQF